MTFFFLSIVIFLSLLEWIVIIDVVLSWLVLFGLRVYIPFLRKVVDPMYRLVRKYLPTTFGAIDFTPIVIFIVMELCINGILVLDPSVRAYLWY